ncbi:Starch-binding associating with outer membrane [Arachidicoccus rhizosphaerae]|uniref:Starch-binding associating with outer membrane n=1 Tax=Arachidicoccus rhizosphaerae TaxID=551991 RepID=A0A1H3Z8Y9_9BACT|nr:RagB/SusD family nutrient uptake outer membrane protein [Arachidicoccus rhizosphaerae]SEA20147.1 Starch-binding associating with outer membrane [Arachidicoccus rhizosphaerae]
MNRYIRYGILGISLGLCTMQSCKKGFLEEDLVTSLSTDDFKTQTGLDALVTGMYQSLRFHFNYEWAYTTTEYGTDEFEVGGDRTMEMWNSYNSNLNSETAHAQDIWDNMYGNINSANIVIQNVPLYYGEGENKNTRLGEGYFMRAFDYFKLVKQYGGVPLKLTPSTSVEREFTRNTAQETYQQVIDDFTQAYNDLPETPEATGRITKYAAAHFLAKAYLYRASELNDDWNSDTKQSDLQNAVKYADIVINSGHYSLAPNYSSLWDFESVDGPNEQLSEIILAAQFSDNTATQGRYGNQVHLYYPSVYQNLPGMQRDIAGDREFQRMRSTDYILDVFDRVNDSRFWKSFKTSYLCNKPSSAPTWTAKYAPSTDLVGKVKFAGGEESIRYIVNDAGDTRYTSDNINYRAPGMYVRYFSGEANGYKGGHGNYTASQYVALSKFMDGSRSTVASQFGQRDGILARLAETYLIAAEAYGRLGEYDKALPYLNAVRDRAAYKDGEDRSAYVDGGIAYKNNTAANTATYVSYSSKNTYYESNDIDASTTGSTLSEMHLNSTADIFNSTHDFYDVLAVSSNADKFLCFILNERSRELAGELMRWEDLARTKTLIKRDNAFNDEATPTAYDYLRPIPQSFLDAIQSNGSALTSAEKEAMQNPGW